MSNIPKIIHQIWIGTKPIPLQYIVFMKMIKDMHPDFEYRLWTNKDFTPENFSTYYDMMKMNKIISRVDMMRYEILYNHGGIYVDCDIYPLRSFSKILEDNKHDLLVCNEDYNINESI